MENPFEIVAKQLNELKELQLQTLNAFRESQEQKAEAELLSPAEVCKLFSPAISKPTLESYAEKGLLKKYYLEGRTWYKRGEVLASLKEIKRYSRQTFTQA
jgi:hypothetical protein